METLLDYIKWMGDYRFQDIPLREADVLIMCVISYFDLTPLFAGGNSEAHVRDCRKMIDEGCARLLITGGDMGNGEVFSAAVDSVRFGSLRLTDCIDILQTEPPLQFAAVTFHCGELFSLISYRGTDSSLPGWKENFMISFTRTRAQELAAEYAHHRISRSKNKARRWYIAGHSKGGNLALYAGCMLSDKELAKTERIFTLDGPGLCPEVMDTSLISRIDSKTTFIIPEFDVVGKLFEPAITDTRIVQSYREGIAQHSLPSWLIDHGNLALTDKNAPASIRINQVFDEWIEGKSPDVRKTFIDELFGLIADNGIMDLQEMKIENLADILISMKDMSETTRAMLEDLGQKALFGEELSIPSLEEVQEQVKTQLLADMDPDEKKPEEVIRKSMLEVIQTPELLQSLVVLPLGLIVYLATGHILDIICLVLVLGLSAAEIYISLRRLRKSGWNVQEQHSTVYLIIVTAALTASLFVKDNASYLFGSIIIGILLLIASYQASERAYNHKESKISRILCTAEAVMTAMFGFSFIVSPHHTMDAHSMFLGRLMMTDGALRLLHVLWRRHRLRRTKV